MHVTRVCVVRARVRMCARAARERERECVIKKEEEG